MTRLPPHPLLATAVELGPRLSARSAEFESARRLPPDVVEEFARAGFFRMLIPEAYGGLELHPSISFQVIEALSRADGAAGWGAMIGSGTGLSTAWLPESVGREVCASPEVIIGGVAAPLGRAERVEGGYRVTGRWPWASGGHHCHWLVGGAVVFEDGKPRVVREDIPETRLLYFPAAAVTLHDTWFSMGLCGTGSGDMEVKDLFVREDHAFSFLAPPKVARPIYGFPFGLLGHGIPAVALGIARRAIEELITLARQKTVLAERRLLAARPSVQEAIAEADAEVRAARAFMLDVLHAIVDEATKGPVSMRGRADLRLAMTHGTRAATRAVDRVYEAAGGPAVFHTHPLQRCFRDIHTLTQHAFVARPTLEVTGGVLLGFDPPFPNL
ncbi:acyl-CoA dehydrogenase family protein [Myxococcus stipitatus]|uniref:acyl-CoA dehydrogenase family protein n=1 Tax=Myxococcus stipitatus TaxID=83455 RepID=UPI0030D3FD81